MDPTGSGSIGAALRSIPHVPDAGMYAWASPLSHVRIHLAQRDSEAKRYGDVPVHRHAARNNPRAGPKLGDSPLSMLRLSSKSPSRSSSSFAIADP